MTLTNGHRPQIRIRFPYVPSKIDVPLHDQEDEESSSVEVDLTSLPDDPTELCSMLETEQTPHTFWILISLAYVRYQKVDVAIEILVQGLESANVKADRNESLPMQLCLLWLYLQKVREAIKAPMNPGEISESKTKDHYLQLATSLLNHLGRFDAEHPAYALGRAVFSSLKAGVTHVRQERSTNWDNAQRLFDEALKRSSNTNLVALMGKARMHFHNKKYEAALECYQDVLSRKPDMDPDPRIGIGLCFWMLGFKDDAKMAWERVLELDPESKVANLLIGVYHLSLTSDLSELDPEFGKHYKKAMTDYIAKAYKMDKNLPMASTLFASYFFSANNFATVEALTKKAIEYTDVGQVARDAYYLLARKHQEVGEYDMARQFYARSEGAKEDNAFLPGKLGTGQLQILSKDFSGAKLIFENIVKLYPKCLEAQVILGTLYAEEAFLAEAQQGLAREDRISEHRKAITYLENVRSSWKDPKKHMTPNASILLTLARLYEYVAPDKAFACLQQVADLEREASEDEEPMLAPQLLNNMGVFQYNIGKWDEARDLFQIALNNCVTMGAKDESLDTDALATTLTYNLARLEEAATNTDEALKLYEGLVARHPDYVEANMRIAYITLRKGGEEGPRRLEELMKTDDYNLELCSMYGYYLSRRPKKSPINLAEDKEQRHYKRSLQNHDKHDKYSLTGMGNLHLMAAREMRRDSETEKDKRRKMYERAVEFFDKALQLDSRNAYAAQGIAIALIEEKKDYGQAVAILSKVKETLKEAGIHINLAHCLIELKQYHRSIENYEIAIKQYHAIRDPWIFASTARAYYLKGKNPPDLADMRNALEYSKKALSLSPDHPIFMFNVAFIQAQICAVIHNLPPSKRSSEDIQAALDGLDEAIKTFTAVAKSKNPPYPSADIEQRSVMGKNTTRRQLMNDLAAQKQYEEANAAKIAEAKRVREEILAAKAAEEARIAKEKEEEKERLLVDWRKQREWDQSLIERRWVKEEEEERAHGKRGKREARSGIIDDDEDDDAEYGSDGEPKKKKRSRKNAGEGRQKKEGGTRRSRKKKNDDGEGGEDGEEGETGGKSRPTKKRKLTRGGKAVLSKETISDSDDLLSEDDVVARRNGTSASASVTPAPDDKKKNGRGAGGKKVKSKAVIDSDDDLSDLPDSPVDPGVGGRKGGNDDDDSEDAEMGDAGNDDDDE